MHHERVERASILLATMIMSYIGWLAYQGQATVKAVYIGLFSVLFLTGCAIYRSQFMPVLQNLKEGKDIYKEPSFYKVLSYLILLTSSVFMVCLFLLSDKIIMNFGAVVFALLMLMSVLTPMFVVLIFIVAKQFLIKSKSNTK